MYSFKLITINIFTFIHFKLPLPEACRGPPFLFESVIFPDMDSACVVLYDSLLQQFYPGVKMEHLKCTYKEVLRDTNHDIIDSYFKLKSAEDLSLPIACVQAEFIWISCKITFNNNTTKTFTQPVMIPKVKPLKVQGNREWSTSIKFVSSCDEILQVSNLVVTVEPIQT